MSFRMTMISLAAATFALPAQAATDWAAVGKALGKTGSVQGGDVYRVGLPRSDLKVTLDGVAIKPALALGSWVAFRDMGGQGGGQGAGQGGGQAMVMGDLVLTQTEIAPVMTTLEDNGIQITGLHNHLLRSSPATMYMHIDGHGDPVKLATALHAALAKSKTPMGASPPAPPAQPLGLDQAMLDRTLGAKGTVNGGVVQYSIPRADAPKADGMAVPPAMGSAIAINFQPTGGGKAATTGDFVLTADEVNPVIKALRAGGIEVTALHNHMLDDEPRLFFMHFWANDDAGKLAKGLRGALDHVKVAGR
jgi:biotin operon repressor